MFAVTFPGQGSQFVGMAKELCDNFPWTKEIYEEASDAISENVFGLCQEGPEETLRLTRNGQPCILTTSYAWFQVLKREMDFSPLFGAGHSLGEYSALLASEALTLTEAVRLVRSRGELMQNAVPVGKGKMAAIIGLEDEAVEKLCQMASQGEDSIVVAVNFNAPGQVVIAGHSEAVDRAVALTTETEDKALKARKAMPLNVSAPFHSPLMAPVCDQFKPHLEAVQWKSLKFPIAFNVDAEIRDSAEPVELLLKQLDHPVLWTGCVKAIAEKEIQAFVEPGPGKVLAGLNKRIDRSKKTHSINSVDDVKQLQQLANG